MTRPVCSDGITISLSLKKIRQSEHAPLLLAIQGFVQFQYCKYMFYIQHVVSYINMKPKITSARYAYTQNLTEFFSLQLGKMHGRRELPAMHASIFLSERLQMLLRFWTVIKLTSNKFGPTYLIFISTTITNECFLIFW